MAKKLEDAKKEQDLASMQRKELKTELADNYAHLPRKPRNRRRIITFGVLGIHPVILNFWSESCIPCLQEVPYLERFYSQYGAQRQFALLGINQADPSDDIAKFGANFHVTYPLLFDKGGIINAKYVVIAIPTTYFIDSRGIVRSVFVQPLTPRTMQQGFSSVGMSMSKIYLSR